MRAYRESWYCGGSQTQTLPVTPDRTPFSDVRKIGPAEVRRATVKRAAGPVGIDTEAPCLVLTAGPPDSAPGVISVVVPGRGPDPQPASDSAATSAIPFRHTRRSAIGPLLSRDDRRPHDGRYQGGR